MPLTFFAGGAAPSAKQPEPTQLRPRNLIRSELNNPAERQRPYARCRGEREAAEAAYGWGLNLIYPPPAARLPQSVAVR